MAEKTVDSTFSGGLPYQMLIGFVNWLWWADFSKAILIEKDVWDLIEVGWQQSPDALWKQEKKIKENWMTIKIVMRIIKKKISNNIFNNIINVTNPQEIWEKF